MPYPTGRRGGGNAFAGYKGASFDDPLSISYKRYKPGAYIRLRILSLAGEDVNVIPCRGVSVMNPQTKQMMTIKDVHEPEDTSIMHDILDHAGNPMSACQQVNLFRCPVFVYFTVDEKGTREDINALRYLEFGQGLKNSLDKLEEFQQGLGAFNEESGRPDYDVDLVVVEGEGSISKNYEFQVVLMDSKSKKQHGHFGVEAEEVLETEGFMDAVAAEWDTVQAAISKRMTEEEIRNRVQPRQENRGSVSSRPGLRDRDSQPAADEVDTSGEAEGNAGRFGGGRSRTNAGEEGGGRRYNR
jgi:hypothetical protein